MTPARLGALVAVAMAVLLAVAALARSQPEEGRSALVILVEGASFEELMAIPEVAALARAGGAGVMANGDDVAVFDGPMERVLEIDGRARDAAGDSIRDAVLNAGGEDLLVIVAGGSSSRSRAAGDGLLGITLARGPASELLSHEGEGGSLTSDSTGRTGVVTGGDVRATIDEHLGGAPFVAGELAPGEPIRIVDGPPPFELSERYLAQRRMYVPVGTAAALYVTAAGLAGIGALAVGRRLSSRPRRVIAWWCLSVPMLATGMLAVGHLPELTYATAVPMIAIVTVFGTMAFSPLERADPTLALAGIGAAVLVLLLAEAVTGWAGMLTPLLGGSQLDGGRFYGLPNVAIGLTAGAGLWVAQRMPTGRGVALLCALGLFAGLPVAGANLGGAVTLFAAAGMWLAVRERDRLGPWMGLGAAAGVTVAGTAAILVAHAVAPVATHVTRFEEEVEGLGGVLDTFVDRLRVGFDLIAGSPAAIVPVLGLPVVLLVVLRPPAVIRRAFEERPAWRDAVLVTILAGIVAYVVNDTGPAAAGLAFGLGLGGMLGVSLLAPQGKMGEP